MKLIVIALFSIGIIESAWAQDLQVRVRELEARFSNLEYRLSRLETGTPRNGTDNPWTCTLVVFDKTYVANGKTMTLARAKVIKQCLDAGGTSVWCKPSAAICSND